MIFTVTCDQFNLGTHFLIWSAHYLSKNDKYHHFLDDSTMQIPKYPLKDATAHKFLANESFSIDDSLGKIDLHLESSKNLNHIKYHPLVKSLEEYHNDNREYQESMVARQVKTINITCRGLQHMVGFLRFHTEKSNWQNDIETVKKHCKHYWPDFFNDCGIYADKLETFHDIREGIAFRLRPYEFWQHHKSINLGNKLQTHDFYNLLTAGETVVREVMSFLNLHIIEDRVEHWISVHKQWSADLIHYLDFCDDIENLVDSIVTNKKVDMSSYKMDVLKEAVLLHLLMFKHDLNIVRPIDRLPQDTGEIFKLLGKNPRTGIKKLYTEQ